MIIFKNQLIFIETTPNEDKTLYSVLKKFNNEKEIQEIINFIFKNKNISSNLVLYKLRENYKWVSLDTIDEVMLWLQRIFLIHKKEM